MQDLPATSPRTTSSGDLDDAIARDVCVVRRLEVLPTLLEVLCEVTGLRFAAVARVTDQHWIACAVRRGMALGLAPGEQLEAGSTFCFEVKESMAPLVINQASKDPHYRNHPARQLLGIESYIAVPIVLPDGRYFGTLCAFDPEPAELADSKFTRMLVRFASLIAMQIEQELKRANDQSALRDERAASELREQFIAVLGHDLRNPLQAIAVSSDLILKRSKEPDTVKIAARIKANSKRMSSLIDDVLDFARGRLGGGIGVDLAERDLEKGLLEVVRELQDGQPDRKILSNISVTRKVRCDYGRIQQVASNLIGNALVHGSSDLPVKVTARADSEDFVLQVWNAGEPIPTDNIAKIFDPFWRRSISANREGLGLGLHICSQIVRAHGGTLTVSSTMDQGTTFTATLPTVVKSEPVEMPA